MTVCSACAAENRDGAKFCRACGVPLVPPAETQVPLPVEAEAPPLVGVEAQVAPPPVEEMEAAPPGEAEAQAALPVEAEAVTPSAAVEVAPPVEAAVTPPAVEEGMEAAPPPVEEVESAPPEEAVAVPGPGELEPAAEEAEPLAGPEEREAEPAAEEQPAGEPEAAPEVQVGALPPGTLLQDRYEVVGLMARQADHATYRAYDRLHCPACGAEVPSGETFCPECGAEQAHPATCLLQEWLVPPEPGEVEGETVFEYGGRTFSITAEEPPPEEPPFVRGVRLAAGFHSVKGPDRAVNQDSLLVLTLSPLYEGRPIPALGLFAVADGIGGHQAGEVASQIAVQVLAQEIISHVLIAEVGGDACLDETLLSAVSEGVVEANAQVYAVAQGCGSDMGSTLAAALVRDDLAVVANVGDSRVYHWHVDTLRRVTTDHSVVERLLEMGEVTPEEAAGHPQRGVLYRSLGDRPSVEVDVFSLQLAPGDRLILCCDGVWESLSDEGLEEVMLLENDPQRICDSVARRALEAGSTDNVSVIAVSVMDL